jgi:glyceraldehyde 3-phosphate dehydrogenase
MVNLAINGFGRIGRMVLKAGINDPDINFVAINDLTDTKTLAHLLRYDSVHGPFQGTIEPKEHSIIINSKEIAITAEKDPSRLPWKAYDVDVALECTGFFRTEDKMKLHLDAGAKKVLLSAPAKGENIKTLVKGVNEHTYDGEKLVSNASCTTNCFAPIAKVLNDNYGIIDGVMTTVHSYTGDQRILDGPHDDLRRARSAALNIVPTSTGAAKAIGSVIPELKGKLIGAAIRVPTPDGSMVHFTAELNRRLDSGIIPEVNELFKNVAGHHMKKVLEYTDESLVSSDIIGNPHSCIFDSKLTECVGNNIIVVGWYDNEWGYSNRMVDIARFISKR